MRSGREHNTPDKAMWGFSCTVRAQVKCGGSTGMSLTSVFYHCLIKLATCRTTANLEDAILFFLSGVIRGCLWRPPLPGRPCPGSVSAGVLHAPHSLQRARGDKRGGSVSRSALLKAPAKVTQLNENTTKCLPVVVSISCLCDKYSTVVHIV